MEADLLCDISSDENDEKLMNIVNAGSRSASSLSGPYSFVRGEEGAVDLSSASSPEHVQELCSPPPPREKEIHQPSGGRRTPTPVAISSDDDDRDEIYDSTTLATLATFGSRIDSPANDNLNTAGKKLQEHFFESDDDESTAVKPATNASLWLDEQTSWQRITASDFDDLHDLSDTDDEIDENAQTVGDTNFWSQSIIPTRYYVRNKTGGLTGTPALDGLHRYFVERVLRPIQESRAGQPRSDPPSMPKFHSCSTCTKTRSSSGNESDASSDSSTSSSSSSLSSSSSSSSRSQVHEGEHIEKCRSKQSENGALNQKSSAKNRSYRPNRQALMAKAEIDRKQKHPAGLHPELCFNEPGQLNDGALCRCSWAAKQTGVRHNKYAGENPIPKCDPNQSNVQSLYHYVLRVTPNPNEFTRQATAIDVDGQSYVFDGFSVFFHQPLPDAFPQTPMNGWSTDFSATFLRENIPESFTVKDLELFYTYLFDNIMELYDVDRMPNSADVTDSCSFFHCMPRFVRNLKDDGKEILPMSTVMEHFANTFNLFADCETALNFTRNAHLLKEAAQSQKGALFVNPEKRPMCIRVDLIDHLNLTTTKDDDNIYPWFTHFGVRPSAYTYNGKPEYQRALRHFVKLRHSLSLKSRLTVEDRQKLRHSESKLKQLRSDCKMTRDIQTCVSSRGFFKTGLFPDVVQHALLLVSMCAHVRFHWSLRVYEHERLHYVFKNRILLELALTHPSYRCNYGTNPDHAKNTINNCGLVQTKVRGGTSFATSEPKVSSKRKRGIAALMEIMSKQGSVARTDKTVSSVNHNERLEFLGDAVVEFITTVHLFFMFSELEEGGLATYRSALVQNKHLASMAKKLGLHEFMLYAHGPDLCHEAELRHAMANAFEAMMAAVFLDSNINECDRIFSATLYKDEEELSKKWVNLPEHPLKREHPFGDRHLIDVVPCLKNLTEFEDNLGLRFKHIRLLAKAFTRRNIGFNYLTLGHNQRLEFLGDTVLQLITTDYLYRHFPNHQEGHLSLLRTCLVSNKTQSVICDDLAIPKYLIIPKTMERSSKISTQLRVKNRADLVESFIGALYVDRGLQYCKVFCRVCFFPRLKYFILTQRWNDPKSQLQQCCLTLRRADSGEPDIPEYKTIGAEGPTNTRVYRVAVYFRNQRLAEGTGGSVQLAQMQAAENALIEKASFFPSFDFSKTYLAAKLAPKPKNMSSPNKPNEEKRRTDSQYDKPSNAKRRRFNAVHSPSVSQSQGPASTSRGFPIRHHFQQRGTSRGQYSGRGESFARGGYRRGDFHQYNYAMRGGPREVPAIGENDQREPNTRGSFQYNNDNKNRYKNSNSNNETPIRFF